MATSATDYWRRRLTGRPPVETDAARMLHSMLEDLRREVDVATGLAHQILEARVREGEIDCQRNALHLLARIEVLSEQIARATEALYRLENSPHSDARSSTIFPSSDNGA